MLVSFGYYFNTYLNEFTMLVRLYESTMLIRLSGARHTLLLDSFCLLTCWLWITRMAFNITTTSTLLWSLIQKSKNRIENRSTRCRLIYDHQPIYFLLPQLSKHSYLLPFSLHTHNIPPSRFNQWLYWGNGTNYEVPYCETLSLPITLNIGFKYSAYTLLLL